MVGKRKRGDESGLEGSQGRAHYVDEPSSRTPQLTQSNLDRFNQQTPSDLTPAKVFPPPFQFIMNQAPATPTGSKKTKTISSVTKADSILDTFRIYLDRNKPMPLDLENLVFKLQEKRGTDVTPKSKFIEATRDECRIMKEDMNLHTLADSILYRGWLYEGDEEGEKLICRGRSDQWYDRVPRPVETNEESNLALHAAMKAQGLPPKPKPDLSYGYRDDAFDRNLTNKRKALPERQRLFSAQPWFPYLVGEWKSAEQSPRKAEQQALRDAAAAIDSLYQLFKAAYPDQVPSPAMTCVFSLCVHYQGFDYRVHWRRVDNDGVITYEGDRVADARYHKPLEVFEARGAILKTLDWVRGARLTAIKDALRAVKPRSVLSIVWFFLFTTVPVLTLPQSCDFVVIIRASTPTSNASTIACFSGQFPGLCTPTASIPSACRPNPSIAVTNIAGAQEKKACWTIYNSR
ncbi:MAG: hypothetical protein Q9209_003998 [Squamulea sp. 1 TL-2023]